MHAFKDIDDVKDVMAGLNSYRLSRTFTWRESTDLGEQYGVDLRPARVLTDRMQLLKEAIVGGGRYCDCTVPEGLRWRKADNDEPVTWSADLTGAQNLGFDWATVIRIAFATYWPQVSKIQFAQVASGEGDIHIGFRNIDGLGGTMGMAYMPSVGERMDVANWSGDIFIDWSERFTFWEAVAVLGHEIGHAIGIDHVMDRDNLMYAIFQGARTDLGEMDQYEAWTRYRRNTMMFEVAPNIELF